jgi:hypothetical protein
MAHLTSRREKVVFDTSERLVLGRIVQMPSKIKRSPLVLRCRRPTILW